MHGPGFGRPEINLVQNVSEQVTLEIVPNPFFSTKKKMVVITPREYDRLLDWFQGKCDIQHVFPQGPADLRELFLTGMDDLEWESMVGEGAEDE